jgi:hypothetical protein
MISYAGARRIGQVGNFAIVQVEDFNRWAWKRTSRLGADEDRMVFG